VKIVKLSAENFKKLVAVEITPDGNTILLTGKNGAGKSSVLDAIFAAFCGKKGVPDKPIRDGQESAEIVVETENFTIKRTFTTAGGGSLTVTNSDGYKAASPQALLDKIVGEIAFDPMKFIHDYDTRKQRQVLMELVGFDFTDLEQQIAAVKQERSQITRDKDKSQHDADAIDSADVPEKEVGLKYLTDKLQTAMNLNAEQDRIMSEINSLNRDITAGAYGCEQAEVQIERLEKELQAAKDAQTAALRRNDERLAQKAKLAESLEPKIDIAAIQAEIDGVESTNTLIRLNKQKAQHLTYVALCRNKFAELGKKMKALEDQKAQRLAEVKMPIAGLSIDESGVTYEGIPLAQVNSAKQLEIGVAVSMALNPKLKVIRMCGNNLDSASLKIINKLVKDKDYQAWIEKVDETGKVGIFIEDGTVCPDAWLSKTRKQ